eukprot:TRINITY_DN21355_c0_g2_i1.p1 TRINITY_DN21355_c0_g2~~TRINITY_DN21355_c0_g2_i1.p1  ORF type:complete len:102 (+),score=9.38 TRINITY_DN21355_c0_g2_i1:111-416(+)
MINCQSESMSVRGGIGIFLLCALHVSDGQDCAASLVHTLLTCSRRTSGRKNTLKHRMKGLTSKIELGRLSAPGQFEVRSLLPEFNQAYRLLGEALPIGGLL